MSVRVRFAPSPTGHLHVGNVRTALFNWLFARQQSGVFILRVEDTDRERSRPEYETQLMEDLRWLGLDWDEGLARGGDYGPYRQSDRLQIYNQYAQKLIESGNAYYCFCTEEELQAERERMAAASAVAYVYSGKCRSIALEEARCRFDAGEPVCLRLKTRQGSVVFDDLVFGRNEKSTDRIGDFVLVRKDGMPLYNFAVVVDDITMKITHVIRGDGHLPNTPKQILIYEALGQERPRFAHLSTVLGEDGEKLSKRHGAVSIAEFRQMGYLPEALINHLALLGWAPSDGTTEVFSVAELIKNFELHRVSKSPAIFDRAKLNYFNRTYLKAAPASRLVELSIPHLVASGYLASEEVSEEVHDWLKLVVDALLGYLDYLSQIGQAAGVIFEYTVEQARSSFAAETAASGGAALEVISALYNELPEGEITLEQYKQAIGRVKELTKQKGKALFHPIRVALTGRESGPELDKLVPIYERGKKLELPRRIPGIRERLGKLLEQA